MPPHIQNRIFNNRPSSVGNVQGRKCIFATNIAESSITIDGIVYVIDPGMTKQKIYNPEVKVESLLIQPISKSSANQRKGRAGRTQNGIC